MSMWPIPRGCPAVLISSRVGASRSRQDQPVEQSDTETDRRTRAQALHQAAGTGAMQHHVIAITGVRHRNDMGLPISFEANVTQHTLVEDRVGSAKVGAGPLGKALQCRSRRVSWHVTSRRLSQCGTTPSTRSPLLFPDAARPFTGCCRQNDRHRSTAAPLPRAGTHCRSLCARPAAGDSSATA